MGYSHGKEWNVNPAAQHTKKKADLPTDHPQSHAAPHTPCNEVHRLPSGFLAPSSRICVTCLGVPGTNKGEKKKGRNRDKAGSREKLK